MRLSPLAISQRTAKILVALFFLAFLLIGIATTGDFGMPWDEGSEMNTLRMNAIEYARHLGLQDALDPAIVASLPPLAESVDRDYGEASLYPLIPVLLNGAMPRYVQSRIMHLYCWAIFTLGAFALYASCRRLGLSRAMGCFAALMLLLSPRFFADGHYNNKDIFFWVHTLLVLWQALRLMQKPTFGTAVLFGLCGAFACNSRIVGLAVWGLCALFVLVYHLAHKTLSPRVAWIGATSLGALCALYVLFTPLLWSMPAGEFFGLAFSSAFSFSRWASQVYYLGELYRISQVPLPWHYLPYLIFATTPLLILLLLFIGLGSFVVGLFRKKLSAAIALPLALVIALALLPLLAAILTHTRTYNGWRHFFFIYGPLLLVSTYGAATLLRARAKAIRSGVAVALAVACLGLGVDTILNHPHEYAYFQPLVRQAILRQENQFIETDYWNMSVLETFQLMAAEYDDGDPITIGATNMTAESNLSAQLASFSPELSSRFTLMHYAYENLLPQYRLVNSFDEIVTGKYRTETMVEVDAIYAYGIPVMYILEDLASY